MRGRGWLAMAACLLATACLGEDSEAGFDENVEDRTPYEQEFVTADTAEAYEAEPEAPGEVPPVAPVQGGRTVGGPLTATGNFRPIPGGVSPGSVTLTEEGDRTRVVLQVNRYTEGTELDAVFVEARCGAPGDVALTVPGTLTVNDAGIATLTGIVDVPTAALLERPYSIRLVNAGATPATAEAPQMVFACANLPTAEGT